jgi:hypothetical protein
MIGEHHITPCKDFEGHELLDVDRISLKGPFMREATAS